MSETMHRRENDGKWDISESKIAIWGAIGTIIVAAISFWAKGADLPGRVSTLEIRMAEHCAAQVVNDEYVKEALNRLLDAEGIERPKEKE